MCAGNNRWEMSMRGKLMARRRHTKLPDFLKIPFTLVELTTDMCSNVYNLAQPREYFTQLDWNPAPLWGLIENYGYTRRKEPTFPRILLQTGNVNASNSRERFSRSWWIESSTWIWGWALYFLSEVCQGICILVKRKGTLHLTASQNSKWSLIFIVEHGREEPSWLNSTSIIAEAKSFYL